MRGIFRLLMLIAMSISLLALFTPVTRAAIVPPVKADCCAKMNTGENQHDCGRQMPKSKQDKQCCAACAVGLTLLLNSVRPFFHPPWKENQFASYFVREHSRFEQPPVPPPRHLSI